MKFIDKIKNYFLKIWVNIFWVVYNYKYFEPYQERVFIDYIEKKAIELSDNEGVKIFSVPFDEMNKNETNDDEKAVGLFLYFKDDKIMAEYDTIARINKTLNITTPRERVYPRIEISEKGDVFTILHELGHYFLYKRGLPQTEKDANLFIEEFFDNYLPPFFKWIYQIEVKIRGNMELKFTDLENYNNWNAYKKFSKI